MFNLLWFIPDSASTKKEDTQSTPSSISKQPNKIQSPVISVSTDYAPRRIVDNAVESHTTNVNQKTTVAIKTEPHTISYSPVGSNTKVILDSSQKIPIDTTKSHHIQSLSGDVSIKQEASHNTNLLSSHIATKPNTRQRTDQSQPINPKMLRIIRLADGKPLGIRQIKGNTVSVNTTDSSSYENAMVKTTKASVTEQQKDESSNARMPKQTVATAPEKVSSDFQESSSSSDRKLRRSRRKHNQSVKLRKQNSFDDSSKEVISSVIYWT